MSVVRCPGRGVLGGDGPVNVIGIDPSLTCLGIARIDDGHTAVTRNRTKQNLGDLRDMSQRIRFLVGTSLKFAGAHIDLTVIESPYTPKHNAGAVLERAWLYGMLVDQFLQRGPVVAVAPMQRAKYAAGTGKAKKPEVLAAVRDAFPGIPLRDDNEADALALAAMGARHLGAPVDGTPTKAQLDAMDAVRWPIERRMQ